MKYYKKDFNGDRFITVEYNNEDNPPKTNLFDSIDIYSDKRSVTDDSVEQSNKNLVSEITETSDHDAIMVRRCKSCGIWFIIDFDEFMWYHNQRLVTPKRCENCRKIRKRLHHH